MSDEQEFNENPEISKKQLGDKIFGAHNNPSKDNDYNDGENIQTSTISISGYYQINYNTEE